MNQAKEVNQMNGAKKHPPSCKQIPKRYVCIAKVGNNPDGSADCKKHRCSDLVKYAAFLDKEFPGWRWFNVYSNRSPDKGQQLSSFTNRNRPGSPRL